MVEGGTGSVRGSDSHESGLTRCREFLDPIFETVRKSNESLTLSDECTCTYIRHPGVYKFYDYTLL